MDEDEALFSHWNHRVIRIKEDDEYYYQIHECHYGDDKKIPHSWTQDPITVVHECHYGDDKKIPHSWTQDPITVGGGSMEDLAWVLDQMKNALSKPVLEEVDDKLREIT